MWMDFQTQILPWASLIIMVWNSWVSSYRDLQGGGRSVGGIGEYILSKDKTRHSQASDSYFCVCVCVWLYVKLDTWNNWEPIVSVYFLKIYNPHRYYFSILKLPQINPGTKLLPLKDLCLQEPSDQRAILFINSRSSDVWVFIWSRDMGKQIFVYHHVNT